MKAKEKVTKLQLQTIYKLQTEIGAQRNWTVNMNRSTADKLIQKLLQRKRDGITNWDEWSDEAIERKLRELK